MGTAPNRGAQPRSAVPLPRTCGPADLMLVTGPPGVEILFQTASRLWGKTELRCISEVHTRTGRLGRDKGWVQKFMFAKNGTKFRTEEAGLELARRSLQPVQFQKPEALSAGHAGSEASAPWAAPASRTPHCCSRQVKPALPSPRLLRPGRDPSATAEPLLAPGRALPALALAHFSFLTWR